MSMYGNLPKTNNPVELFEYLVQQRNNKALPKEEQDALFSKPIPEESSSTLDFFADMWDNITTKSKQAREEANAIMDEEALRSAEEAALFRMESGIKESLAEPYRKPTSDLAEGTSLRPMMREDIVSLGEPEGDETLPSVEEVTTTELEPADIVDEEPAAEVESEDSLKEKDVVTAALEANTDTDTLSKNTIIDQVRDIVGDNMYAAGILGAFSAESGSNFDALEENMNYSLSNAQAVFSNEKIDRALQAVSPEVRQKIKAGGRDPAFGEALMSHYGGGGRYHGRGLIHITHDYNYRAVGERIGVDLVNNPDLVKDPRYAVPAAIAFLEINGYFEGPKPTKDSLQRIVNSGAPAAVKNKRWRAAQDYLKSFKSVPEKSLRPKLKPEEEE